MCRPYLSKRTGATALKPAAPVTPSWNVEAMPHTLAHDLRSPLLAISGYAHLLTEGLGHNLSDPAAHYLREIHSGIDRVQNMLTQWLSFISQQHRVPHRELVDISTLAYSVVADLHAANPKRVIEVHIAPGLHAHGDPILLRRVFQNLLGNAWKFTKSNDAPPKIEIGANGSGTHQTFFIRDNGCGFSDKDAEQLFAPFKQLKNVSDHEGYGLGLAIVHGIITTHGGEVWATGNPGQGATFYFTLPTMDSQSHTLAGIVPPRTEISTT